MYLPFPNLSDLISQYCTDEFKGIEQLYPDEEPFIAGTAAKRQIDFSTGRFCARKALEKFGLGNAIILMKEDKQAAWPEGFSGSISHSKYMTGAVAAKNSDIISVGLDIETIGGIEAEMWDILFTNSEQEFLRSLSEADQKTYTTLLFSAKESFYKFQFPLTARFLEFNDVEIKIAEEKILLSIQSKGYPDLSLENAEIEWTLAQNQLISLCYLKT
ncbi:4'-phosphopantetheinyl transferase superfamily protein [Daejeonella sp. H1SJ63]|jgi:4'-phosphopantetheinyl transferase EntD|uniref:4'-phosphopantetheinyl transferase family protein n=1 Tax=Daejeonella sp. H1SJ63 TaxID=3034145 RepID=UPI0023ED3158|nr:4'-phosphopantetheinyl transferase superfamily protein [Daejeonella sp. H1SJ63]